MKTQTIHTRSIETAARHAIKAAVLALTLIIAGCGSGGGGGASAPAAVIGVSTAPAQSQASANSFTVASDSYGMQSATYLSSTKSSLGIVMLAAIATSMTDSNFKTVSRIDIAPNAAISTSTVYSLGGATAGNPAFPGMIYFLNGQTSSLLRTVDGSITFTAFGNNSGDRITGSYRAVIEDGNDSASPKARYTVAVNFDYLTDSYGPVAH
jgi:hypothetical protein